MKRFIGVAAGVMLVSSVLAAPAMAADTSKSFVGGLVGSIIGTDGRGERPTTGPAPLLGAGLPALALAGGAFGFWRRRQGGRS